VSALEGFIAETQTRVTGTVTIRFEGGQARPVARDSKFAAYSAEHASFDTETVGKIKQEDATGVAKYHGFQRRLANEAIAANAADEEVELATDGSGDEDDE